VQLTHRLTYPLLAGIFLVGGMDAVKDPDSKVPRAERVVPRILSALGVQARTEDVVRVNGVVQVAAAACLAANVFPRIAAEVLVASLLPTTIAGHRFWEEGEPAPRAMQLTHFLKNLAVIGGLVLVATDRRKRASLSGARS